MRKDLIERLYELSSEIIALREKHGLYSGEIDVATGDILDSKSVDPRNIQQRESVQALADLYPKVVEYNTLAEIALEQVDLDKDQEKDIKIMKIIAGAMIRYCKKNIDYAISLLPE